MKEIVIKKKLGMPNILVEEKKDTPKEEEDKLEAEMKEWDVTLADGLDPESAPTEKDITGED